MDIDKITQTFIGLRETQYNIDSEDWTESDTRSKFIDTILIGCLGWREIDIRRELSSDKKRLDYLLSTSRPIMVVEAKRASNIFPVLDEAKTLQCQIKKMIKTNPGLTKSLEQVVEYCQKFSTPLASLTNGRTYITFIGVRTDGIPWQDGLALIIPNIYDEKFNFADLYNLLSRTTIMSGRLSLRLMEGELPSPPQNVLSTYTDPNSIIPRNPIGLALEPLLIQVFSDVTREDSTEVLEHCYVLPGETRLRDEEFEALLLDKPPRFTDAVLDVSTLNSFEKFQESIKDYLSRSRWAQTVFVIGGLGVGKTTFLRRYFTVVAPTLKSGRNTCPFYIDFRKPELDPHKVPEFIYEKLKDQIIALDEQTVLGESVSTKYDMLSLEGLQQVFWPQIQQFMKGPQGKLREIDSKEFEKEQIKYLSKLQDDNRKFVQGAFRVLRERYHRHVCVIIDNADQCNPDYQNAVYLFSRNLEATLECLVIVALREEWYWHFGKSGGPLSAYHDMVYHIPAPRVREVLRKRLDYSLKLLEQYQIPPATAYLPGNIALEAKHLNKYLESCQRAFFENEDITVFYECLSNGNIRKGLDIFLDFLRSGHTHVDEYLRAFVSGGNYTIAFHQVFKPISRGSYQYYCSSRSRIPNIFMPITGVSGMQVSYFSRIYLLHYLAFRSKSISMAGQGFVPLNEVFTLFSNLGISNEARNTILKMLFDWELIESDLKMVPNIEDWSFLRITGFGLHLIRVLSKNFSYIESVMLDTPITSQAMHTRISGLYLEGTKPSLHQRILCEREFLDYLRKEEVLEQMRAQSAGIAQHCPEVMSEIIGVAGNQFDALEEIAKKEPAMQDV